MKRRFAFSVLVLLFTLAGSSFAFEGFYFPESLPTSYLSALRLNEKVIQNSSLAVGQIGSTYDYPIKDQATLERIKKWISERDPRQGRWFDEYYSAIRQISDCSQGCVAKNSVFLYCSAVIVKDPISSDLLVATAKHCLWYMDLQTEGQRTKPAIFKALNPKTKKIVKVVLEETFGSQHYLPFETIFYRIPKSSQTDFAFVEIASQPSINGDSVYTIGVPYLLNRTLVGSQVPPYDLKISDIKVSLGRTIFGNLRRASYCAFSNHINIANPKSWKAQSGCDFFDYSQIHYPARQEKNFMLTDTDMTYGISGAPLFNSAGQLIGIGNSILDTQAENYNPTSYGIYSKAENLRLLLQMYPPRK